MKIAYYMVFKPLHHKNPSGDLIIGKSIYEHLSKEHELTVPSNLRSRWIYYKPHKLLQLFFEYKKTCQQLKNSPPNVWLSYHSYYKAPDLLGMLCARKLGISYVIFQGIYSTKRRKKLNTYLGFWLNKHVLKQANLVITNKKRDLTNLRRLLPEENILYIAPGINHEEFVFDEEARNKVRTKHQIGKNEEVIVSAAMFRPGVKTEGLIQVIKSFKQLVQNTDCRLLIVGDGANRDELEQLALPLGNRIIFAGKVARNEMSSYYSAGDIFAFPGIQEGFGMVYAEAQSCGLPCVAFEDWGASEAIIHNQTGLLSPAAKTDLFTQNIARLLKDKTLRNQMSKKAIQHIKKHHNLESNYNSLSQALANLHLKQ